MSEADRVSYTLGMKLNAGNYSSINFSVSLTSDCADGETPDQALKRVKRFVEKESEKKFLEISKDLEAKG